MIENTQRDLNIDLINELAMMSEKIGIDVMEVIEGAITKWNFNVYYLVQVSVDIVYLLIHIIWSKGQRVSTIPRL